MVRDPGGGRSGRLATWSAYAASGWMALFAAVHLYWAVGGAAGLPSDVSIHQTPLLFAVDLVAIPLSLVGALLALALVRPRWLRSPRLLRLGGRRRRWLLLVAAWATTVLLLGHALPTVVAAVVLATGVRAAELTERDRFSLYLYEPYWLLGGVLFLLATVGYQRNHRARSAT